MGSVLNTTTSHHSPISLRTLTYIDKYQQIKGNEPPIRRSTFQWFQWFQWFTKWQSVDLDPWRWLTNRHPPLALGREPINGGKNMNMRPKPESFQNFRSCRIKLRSVPELQSSTELHWAPLSFQAWSLRNPMQGTRLSDAWRSARNKCWPEGEQFHLVPQFLSFFFRWYP